MGNFFHTVGVVINKMFIALLSWGVVAGGAALGWIGWQSHRLPLAAEWGLVIMIAVIGGLLGAVSRLAWELTHIGQIVHAVRSRQTHSVSHTRP